MHPTDPTPTEQQPVVPPKPYPGIGQSIWLLFLLTVLILVIALILFSTDLYNLQDPNPAVDGFMNLIAIGLILSWGFRKTRADFGTVFPLVSFHSSLLLPMIITLLGSMILLSEADNLLRVILPMPPAIAKIFEDLVGSGSVWNSIFVLMVVAPFTEEFLFRGLFLHGFLKRYSARKAILASAILFGAFHMNPWQFFGATMGGILFAWWFVHTRSLIPCIIGHAIHNGMPILFVRFFSIEIPGFTSNMAEHVFQPLWFDGLGFVLTGTGIWWLMRQFKFLEELKSPTSEPDPSNGTANLY